MKRKQRKILDTYLSALPHSHGGTSWRPAADVLKTNSGWLIKLELAGVDPHDVDVKLANDSLVVRGLRRDCEVSAGCHVHSMEISYSRFERTIRLPIDLEDADTKVESRYGMMLIWIRKKEPE